MIGTMQQLLQAKSADGGQEEEKSGGSGRGDVNDDSGGAGRVPREEGAASTSRVAGGTEGHTSVMSRSDSLSKYSTLPPP